MLFKKKIKQRLYIFSLKLSNENKQRLYKIQKCPTSLFYQVLLMKQNECNTSILSWIKKHLTSYVYLLYYIPVAKFCDDLLWHIFCDRKNCTPKFGQILKMRPQTINKESALYVVNVKWVYEFWTESDYRISSYNCRGNYSFLEFSNLENFK